MSPTFKYKFNGFHYDFEISKAANAYIESQQPTYSQEVGDCTLNAITELTNKTLIGQNLIPKESIHDIRMSRAQISYNGLFVTKDPLDGFHGDYRRQENGHYSQTAKIDIVNHLKGSKERTYTANDDLRSGNSYDKVFRSLFSGMGPVKEKDVNDTSAYSLCNLGSNDLGTEDVYYTQDSSNKHYAHLTQTRQFPVSADPVERNRTNNRIKTWIYAYGAVAVSVDMGGDDYRRHYNFENNSIYRFTDTPNGGGHAMTIVGWDDTFPAEVFAPDNNGNTPDTQGAWLVKNSWNPFNAKDSRNGLEGKNMIQNIYGTELIRDDPDCDYSESTPFSCDRYFWLSYDSPSIDAFYGVSFEDNKYFDNLYQYDGYQKNTGLVKPAKAANIFTIKNPDNKPTTDKAQELKCVGFETSAPANYTIEIYRNIPEGGSPTSGTLVNTCTTTGSCPNAGIYTEELTNPVTLAQGERYSVVVTLESTNEDDTSSKPGLYVEVNDDTKDRQRDHIGESFYFDPASNEWKDIAKWDMTNKKDKNSWPENVRIKAMTVNTDESSPIPTTPTPDSPTPIPVSDCAKLDVKAKVTGSYTGFECMVETDADSSLNDQLQCIRITKTDGQGNTRTSKLPLSHAKKTTTENGKITRSLFLTVAPSDYENTIKFEVCDKNNCPIKYLLSCNGASSYKTEYTTSLAEHLDKLKEAAIANNDRYMEEFANALFIHMACAQSIYNTEANDDNNIDLSVLDSINAADFASYKLKRETTGNTDGTVPQIGLSFNWKKTNALTLVYYDAMDSSTIKSILVDGDDITTDNPEMYQFEEIDGRNELTINLSDIQISDFSKPHTIIVEETSGNQTIVEASVYSYIYNTLKTQYTDQTTKNYAKSLALLAKSYNQLDMSNTRYKDFFLF